MNDLPQGLKVCNCACCRDLLSGIGQVAKYAASVRPRLPPEVAGHVDGRPYCAACLATRNERLERDSGGGIRVVRKTGGMA